PRERPDQPDPGLFALLGRNFLLLWQDSWCFFETLASSWYSLDSSNHKDPKTRRNTNSTLVAVFGAALCLSGQPAEQSESSHARHDLPAAEIQKSDHQKPDSSFKYLGPIR